jgi:Protein of unknown function (DUF1329)
MTLSRSLVARALASLVAIMAFGRASAADLPGVAERERVAADLLQKAGIKVGDVIDKQSADKVKDIVSEGILWLARNGTTLDIVPYRPIPVPKDFLDATEKYSPQVALKDDRTLENWVAGLPFPHIDVNDPEAGTKVMHNFQRTHYFTESLDLNLMDADTGTMYRDAKGRPKYVVERHFIPEWLRLLRFQGRLWHDPKPEILPNKDDVFYKAGLYPLIEPFDLKGVGGVSFRYLDQKKHDDTWLYLPLLRRVRRISTTQRSDALFGQDVDIDSFGGYAGQIPWFTWKLLGYKPMLASLHGKRLPPEPCKEDGGMTFCEPWEPRPGIYIVEGSSIFPNYAFSKRVIYVDAEGWIIPYGDMYDWAGELWKNVHISFRVDTKPNPKVDFSYPEERMFAYAFTVVDMQLKHSTRVAIPGLAFQHEPGWYLDLGMDAQTSVGEEWFSVQSLISGGR